MRHLSEHERGLIALALLRSADHWDDLGTQMASKAPRVAQAVHRQAAYARQLANDVIDAKGVVLL